MLSQIFDSVEGGIFQDVLVGIVVLAAVIGIIVYVTHKPKGGDE